MKIREKRVNKLKRYLSPQIVDTVISKGNDISLENSRKLLTIFFSDIRGFTTMTEYLEPEDTVNLLNEYFSEMTKLVFKHGGTDGIYCYRKPCESGTKITIQGRPDSC
jgi:class 3 adenylate cyclase